MEAFKVKFPDLANDSVARTPMSGAWHEKGDIVKRDPRLKKYFPWCVECKCQKAMPSLERLLVGRTKLWQTAWEQAIDQALAMDEMPLLVWRKAPKDPILCATSGIYVSGEAWEFDVCAKGCVFIFLFDEFLEYAEGASYRLDNKNEPRWYYLNRFFKLALFNKARLRGVDEE